MEEYFGLIIPREEIDDSGRGARAPRQPMRKRMTSSLERQQNLSRMEAVVKDEEGRLVLDALMLLLLLEASRFLSHFPLYRTENRLLMPFHTTLLGTISRLTPCFINSSASISLVHEHTQMSVRRKSYRTFLKKNCD